MTNNKTKWFYKIKTINEAKEVFNNQNKQYFSINDLSTEINILHNNEIGKCPQYTKMFDADNYNPDWDHAMICYVVYFLLWGEKYKKLYQDKNNKPDFEKFRNYFGGETIFNNGKNTIGNFMILPKNGDLNRQRHRCFGDDSFKTFDSYKKYIDGVKGINVKFLSALQKNSVFFNKKFFNTFFLNVKFKKSYNFNTLDINDFLLEQNKIINDFIDQRTDHIIKHLKRRYKII